MCSSDLGIEMDENGQGMDAIHEVGPGGHYLGCAHTQANFKTAFWRSSLLDYRPFETWDEDGAKDTMQLANEKVKRMLAEYVQPAIDPAIDEALVAFNRALAIETTDERQRLYAQLHLGELLVQRRRLTEGRRALQEALDLATQAGDATMQRRAQELLDGLN